jgi:general secretion pathway protein G
MKTLRKLRRPANAAFTLLEIMLVIIIVVALMAVLLPNLRTAMADSKDGLARIYISKITGSLAQYELQNGSPPSTSQGLKALVDKPDSEPRPRRWRQQLEKLEQDPWGIPYNYTFPGTKNKSGYDVYSSGPDRQPNTGDDIGNWE